jgi:hypothetical protein
MNGLAAGAWLILSSTFAIPYSSMHLCNVAKEQVEKNTGNNYFCIIGNNPMYGDMPKQTTDKK